jgi:DNA-binding transcriptional LysR family regulator
MRGPDLADMTAFVAVAERRSFAQAAVQLGVSRSRLSETIRGLEERVGLRLLNRTTRSVAPTAAGERLLARLRPLLEDFGAALDSINEFRDKPAGLSADSQPPESLMGAAGPRFPRIPGHDLRFRRRGPDRHRRRPLRCGHPLRPASRDMIARCIEGIRTVVAAAPSYLALHPAPVRPRDLEAHDCIRFRFPSGVILPWQFEKRGKQIEVAPMGRLTLNDPELAIRAAVDGIGVIYTPLGHAAAEIEAGRLVPLLEDWRKPGDEIFLYYPSRRRVPAPLQAFIEFLRENLPAR